MDITGTITYGSVALNSFLSAPKDCKLKKKKKKKKKAKMHITITLLTLE